LTVKAVDLFCGAGGLTHGLLNAGIEVVAGYDIAESCRFAYEHNNNAKFINQSVTELTAEEIIKHFDGAEYRLLAGCAPCQPFSSYSRTRRIENDHRWDLLTSFGRLVDEIRPEFVTMENVPGLIEQDVFKNFIDVLSQADYQFDYKVVFCPDYGMAQSRRRLVLVASRLGMVSLIPPTHKPDDYLFVEDVISGQPAIQAGETHEGDPLHRAQGLNPKNMQRILASRPGGTWLDWPEELRAECHKKESGQSYSAVYGRMSWDKLSPTITTQCTGFGNGRFGHPEQHRAISLREAALLQSFPLNYKFLPDGARHELAPLAKMIGNAVPVRLGEIVGETITEHVRSLRLTA
jgi:DNA (cytosine-5)-methyltransferase 1